MLVATACPGCSVGPHVGSPIWAQRFGNLQGTAPAAAAGSWPDVGLLSCLPSRHIGWKYATRDAACRQFQQKSETRDWVRRARRPRGGTPARRPGWGAPLCDCRAGRAPPIVYQRNGGTRGWTGSGAAVGVILETCVACCVSPLHQMSGGLPRRRPCPRRLLPGASNIIPTAHAQDLPQAVCASSVAPVGPVCGLLHCPARHGVAWAPGADGGLAARRAPQRAAAGRHGGTTVTDRSCLPQQPCHSQRGFLDQMPSSWLQRGPHILAVVSPGKLRGATLGSFRRRRRPYLLPHAHLAHRERLPTGPTAPVLVFVDSP